ncbi:hypothetical protein [Pantoea vagans]
MQAKIKNGTQNQGGEKKVPQPDQVCQAEKSKEIRDKDNRGKTAKLAE